VDSSLYGKNMPYILIQITREGVTQAQKKQLINGATDLVVNVLNKDPAATFVVIEEIDTDNWGVAGRSVTELRAKRHQ
jgi:4-oxalocrotonate tautomerase